MRLKALITFFLGCFICLQANHKRVSSDPYISGDGFRAYADFIYDETQKNFSPKEVKSGNVIFVKTDYLQDFFKTIHPKIHAKYILISHNSDHSAPGKWAKMLKDKKIIAWFAQNVESCSHPKLHPIPIGIANQYWGHGDPVVFDACLEKARNAQRNKWLCMNFSTWTFPSERNYVWKLFENKPFCNISINKPLEDYLNDLTQSKFALSPRGNGIDCHRTWEILYMGAIPIVKSSSLNPLYQDLPVLIIQSWEDVTLEFLNQKYEEISQNSYLFEKLTLKYWLKLIDFYKEEAIRLTP